MKNKIATILGKGGSDVKTKAVLRNVFYSGGVKAANVCIVYLMVPLLIGYLDTKQYGVWLTIVTFTSWFALFDLGLGNGMKNKLIEFLNLDDIGKAKKYVTTTYFTMTAICGLICLAGLIITPLIPWDKLFNVGAALKQQVCVATAIVLLFTLVNILLRLSNNLLHAHQHSYQVDLISMLSQGVAFLAVLVVKHYFPPSLIVIALAYSISQVLLLLVINSFLFLKNYRNFIPRFRFYDRTLIRQISSMGGQFFFIQIAALIMYMTDNFIIANLFGPDEVTVYNVALKYFGALITVWGMVVVPLWPMITKAYHSGDIPWIKLTMRKLLRLWVLTLLGAIIMLLLAGWVYKIWLGQKVVVPLAMNIALLVYICVSVFATIMATFINGIGKIKLQAYITCFVALINVPVAVLFSKWWHWGVVGVPAATTFCLIISSLIAMIQVRKIIRGTATGIWAR